MLQLSFSELPINRRIGKPSQESPQRVEGTVGKNEIKRKGPSGGSGRDSRLSACLCPRVGELGSR